MIRFHIIWNYRWLQKILQCFAFWIIIISSFEQNRLAGVIPCNDELADWFLHSLLLHFFSSQLNTYSITQTTFIISNIYSFISFFFFLLFVFLPNNISTLKKKKSTNKKSNILDSLVFQLIFYFESSFPTMGLIILVWVLAIGWLCMWQIIK